MIQIAAFASTATRSPARVGGLPARLVGSMVAALVLLIAVAHPTPTLAAAPPLVPVSVSIHAPQAGTIGSEVSVVATIRRRDGLPPTGLRVALYISGKYVLSEHADTHGNVAFRVRALNTAVAGKYAIEARFDGAHGLAPNGAASSMVLRPAHITITTIPAIAGLPIKLGTQTASTTADGKAQFDVSRVGNLALDPLLDQSTDPSIRVSFARWADSVFVPTRTISVQGDATYFVGLRTAYRTTLHFVDLAGASIDQSTISKARFTSSTGAEIVLTSFGDAWWEAGTAVSRVGGLQPSATLWRLADVQMAGTNVVNQGQQAFNPTINGNWTVTLLLYDLNVRAEDALTGGAMGGSVELVYPDSSSRTQPVGSDGTAHFTGLPRGSYSVKIKASGMTPPTPIALSRSQSASIRVISYLDIGLAVGIVLLVVLALLLLRYRQLGVFLRVAHAPALVADRLRLSRASGAVRRSLPPAAAAMGRLPSDVATIEGGRTAAALALLTSAARRTWQETRRLAQTAAAAVVAPRRSRAPVGPSAPARTSGVPVRPVPQARAPLAAVLPPAPARASRAPVASPRAPAGVPAQPRRSRGQVGPPTPPPAWPSSPPDAGERPLIRGSKSVNVGLPASAAPPAIEEDIPEPTHDCSNCGREVPDSARFCRMCGHVQG